MEKESDLTGIEGAHYDFGARIYDSRLGRWLAIDPMFRKFPPISPYVFALNNPIYWKDYNGEDIIPTTTYNYAYGYNKEIKSIHDFGNTSIQSLSFTPSKTGGIGTVHVNILINMNYQFNNRPVHNTADPNAPINKENPGLHHTVLTHEEAHRDQFKEISMTSTFSIFLGNNQKFEGKLDEVFTKFHNIYTEEKSRITNSLDQVKELQEKHGKDGLVNTGTKRNLIW